MSDDRSVSAADARTAAQADEGGGPRSPGRGRLGSAPPPTVRRAPHVTDDSDMFVQLCANALSDGGLHHVAQYRWGVFNYSADILDRLPRTRDGLFGDEDPDVRRQRFARLGRQLHYVLGRMDHVLRSVDSGRLIRSVLQSDDGAVFHYYFRADEYLTGISLDARTVDAGDRAMAELVADFRRQIGLPALNPGGFTTESHIPAADPWSGSKEPQLRAEGDWGTPEPAILARCAETVAADGLHYAGYFDPEIGRLTADVFDDPVLSGFFRTIGRDERRTRYRELGERLHYVVARLNRSLHAVMPGRLARVVLDVEEGALYYADQREGRFLLGVSLDQSQVARADRRMTELVRSLPAIAGG